jgi:hypothetical protein
MEAHLLDLEAVIEELHDSEINGSISWFYDGVWRVRLGDDANGVDAETPPRSYRMALLERDGTVPGQQFRQAFPTQVVRLVISRGSPRAS